MKLAVAICAVLALATLDAEAGGGRGGGGGRGHAASGGTAGHPFPHRGPTRVFVGTTFVGWSSAYPGMYFGPGYYAPAVAAPVAYWYYCEAAAAYYPYVQNCPGGWELVMPSYPGY
jgi:hypothetical protein